jgi:hypothetical protein
MKNVEETEIKLIDHVAKQLHKALQVLRKEATLIPSNSYGIRHIMRYATDSSSLLRHQDNYVDVEHYAPPTPEPVLAVPEYAYVLVDEILKKCQTAAMFSKQGKDLTLSSLDYLAKIESLEKTNNSLYKELKELNAKLNQKSKDLKQAYAHTEHLLKHHEKQLEELNNKIIILKQNYPTRKIT